MLANLSHKTQLIFWNTTINILTHSPLMRWLVKHSFKIFSSSQFKQWMLMAAGSALAGLLCGYTLFIIAHVLH